MPRLDSRRLTYGVSSRMGLGNEGGSHFSGRLAPRRSDRQTTSRSLSPLSSLNDSRSPLQRQLRKHERFQKSSVQRLGAQLEAVYAHLEALEHDERARDSAIGARFERDSEGLRMAIGEMAGLADRLAAVEETQREAAAQAAAQAGAMAATAAEVQGLRAHADAASSALDKLASSQREVAVAARCVRVCARRERERSLTA